MLTITLTCASALTLLILLSSCTNTDTITLAPPSPRHLPNPNQSEIIIIASQAPPDVTSKAAKRYYRNGFQHMRDAEWFYAESAYSETIHMHPRTASAYIARGAANLYQGKHQDAIRDYTSAIEIAPDKPDYWLRRAYAASTADPRTRKRPSLTPLRQST